jgi:hypothetical protein
VLEGGLTKPNADFIWKASWENITWEYRRTKGGNLKTSVRGTDCKDDNWTELAREK